MPNPPCVRNPANMEAEEGDMMLMVGGLHEKSALNVGFNDKDLGQVNTIGRGDGGE